MARALIGASLFIDGVGGVVVETEAYDQDDPASHTFVGPTKRNAVMFGPPGPGLRLPLVRSALVPERRLPAGRAWRGRADPRDRADRGHRDDARATRRRAAPRLLCSGPGRLGQALAVTHALNGARLDRAPFRIVAAPDGPIAVASDVRIGISKAREQPWRFVLAGSPYVSRPLTTSRVPRARHAAQPPSDQSPG